MVHVCNVTVPDNLTELGTICTQFKIWNDFESHDRAGTETCLGRCGIWHRTKGQHYQPSWLRVRKIEKTRTPKFKTFPCRV